MVCPVWVLSLGFKSQMVKTRGRFTCLITSILVRFNRVIQMVRLARKKSSTGIYHVMLRGIDKRNIFLDDEDREIFLEKLKQAKEIAEFKLFGYCLMDNHVHLLLESSEELGVSIKRIAVAYVHWHNSKYERTGHLFQNRYLSETVESDSYLTNVLRYIHQNPIKANIANRPDEYLWSSYHQYKIVFRGHRSFIDTDLVMAFFNTEHYFDEYMNASNNDEFLDYKPIKKLSDASILNILKKEIDINNLLNLPKEERNNILRSAYQKTGASIRQLGRVLGIGKTIIENALKEDR